MGQLVFWENLLLCIVTPMITNHNQQATQAQELLAA